MDSSNSKSANIRNNTWWRIFSFYSSLMLQVQSASLAGHLLQFGACSGFYPVLTELDHWQRKWRSLFLTKWGIKQGKLLELKSDSILLIQDKYCGVKLWHKFWVGPGLSPRLTVSYSNRRLSTYCVRLLGQEFGLMGSFVGSDRSPACAGWRRFGRCEDQCITQNYFSCNLCQLWTLCT